MDNENILTRDELIFAVVEEYMQDLLNNPEVVRTALEAYFEQRENAELKNLLNGFMHNKKGA